jgi:2-haloacid dehalogenase
VVGALARLREHGFTLVALTNSAQATVEAQLAQTGLDPYFAHILSVATARCYKPHPQAYALAANALGCTNAELRLIAAHDWDVTGAMRTGCAGAFVARHGETINALGETPDIIGSDLADVADQLIDKEED